MIILAEEKAALAALATVGKVLGDMTVKGQSNGANKSVDAVVENMTKLTLAGIMDVDTWLKNVNGVQFEKDFGIWRGHQKKAKLKLGDASEEE